MLRARSRWIQRTVCRPSGTLISRTPSVGIRAFGEGAYGASTSLRRTRPCTLLIAGGLGITPVRAMLEEEATGDVVVLYRVRSEADAVLLNEVRHLMALRGGHLLASEPARAAPRRSAPAVCTGWSPTSPNATYTYAARPP